MYQHKITNDNAEEFGKSAGTYLKTHNITYADFFAVNDLLLPRRNIVDIRKLEKRGYKAVGMAYPFTDQWILLMDKEGTNRGRVVFIQPSL
jgi:hypothetical protein